MTAIRQIARMKLADLPQLSTISVAEKLLLVEDIWDEIAAQPDALPLPDWHRRELDRDHADYLSNPNAGTGWPEVKARLLARR